MWVLLSSRIRTWLALAIAVPLLRRVIAGVARSRAASHPDARSTAALRQADATLARLQGRRGRARR